MEIHSLIEKQRAYFNSGASRSVDSRRQHLERLRDAMGEYESQIIQSLSGDLGKSPQDAYVAEIAFVLGEIRHVLRHLGSWSNASARSTPLSLWPGCSRVLPEPFGVSLIIGPWNYPFQLLILPLVSALAAGNTVVLKPSEIAPQTAEVVRQMIGSAFRPECVAVVTGDHGVAHSLLQEKWDKIFFTGSTQVGRLVMAAAAKALTPVTLELGGKCPCIVTADARLDVAARRIVWGKFMNAGQTCVAPDHVWVDRRIAGDFLEALKRAVRAFYGDEPKVSADYGRIVNQRHIDRLIAYLNDGQIECGGQYDREARYLAPTILTHVKAGSQVMAEEIFGPILPILEFDDLEDVFNDLRGRPVPLAMYLFSESRELEQRVIASTRSGGVCVNDTLSHLMNRNLPFGGLGESGMGAYHGKAGFDCFSHQRSVMSRGSWLDPLFRYPPMRYTVEQLKRVVRFMS